MVRHPLNLHIDEKLVCFPMHAPEDSSVAVDKIIVIVSTRRRFCEILSILKLEYFLDPNLKKDNSKMFNICIRIQF